VLSLSTCPVEIVKNIRRNRQLPSGGIVTPKTQEGYTFQGQRKFVVTSWVKVGEVVVTVIEDSPKLGS